MDNQKYNTIKKREKDSQDKRQLIIKTAKAMFSEQGFDHVSVRDIARQANMTTGALYYHFKNKQEILDASYASEVDEFERELESRFGTESSLESIRYFFCEMMARRLLSDGLEFTRHRMFQIQKHSEKNSKFYRIIFGLVERTWKNGILKQALTPGQITDYLLLVYRGTTMEWCYQMEGGYDLLTNMSWNMNIAIQSMVS